MMAQKKSGRVIVAENVSLAYTERGDGAPVVFIPHWTFTKDVFDHQLLSLSRHYRVITYDPRGQGASDLSMEGNDYLSHAHDLAVLLDTIQAERPVLVGWGAGALTAWGFAKIRGAEALRGLAVIDCPPHPLSDAPNAWTEGSLEEIAATHTLFLRDAKGHANFMRRYIETVLVERRLSDEEEDWLLAQSLTTPPLVAANLYASWMFADMTNAAIATARAAPTLFFIAQHWAERAVTHLGKILPEAQTVVFGGRMMFWEHVDAFNHVLGEFLATRVLLGESVEDRV
jgi:pimeloyl-ACP methyl ester carboxylesterase